LTDIEYATAYDDALSTTVSVLPVRLAKGLEVDAAIVPEPAKIITRTAQSMQFLSREIDSLVDMFFSINCCSVYCFDLSVFLFGHISRFLAYH